MSSDHLIADASTIALARAGDLDALGALWRIYQPQVLRFLRARRCPAPDDVASQVWIDVGRSFDGFDGDGRAFQRWVFTIARNRSIDEIRRVNRRAESSLDPSTPTPGARSIGVANSEDHTDPAEAAGSLEWALALINRLPADQAEAVMLRVVADMSVTETALVMGHSESNVRVLVHRGLTRLRTVMVAQDSAAAATVAQEVRDSCNAAHSPIVSQV